MTWLKPNENAPLQVLMPMAGRGSRFAAHAPHSPKPLIPVSGLPMFRHALDSLAPLPVGREVVAVVRAADVGACDIGARLASWWPGIGVALSESPTRGPVESCLCAERSFVPNRALLVLDCDLRFTAPAFLRRAAVAARGQADADAVLLCFPSRDPRYSFAELDGDSVVDVAEKRAISGTAICGAYLFRSAACFFDAARRLMRKPPMPEYYVSGACKELLVLGGRIKAVMAETVLSFGTPEELARSAPLLPALEAA